MKFDSGFINRLRQKDTDAFRDLYFECSDGLYKYILFKVFGQVEAAEDILSEVFCDAINYSAALTAAHNIYSWLFRIARSKIADYFRKKRIISKTIRAKTILSAEIIDGHILDHASPEKILLKKENLLFISAVFERLPQNYRTILNKKYLENMSVEKIAENLDKSCKSVESVLFRARKKFMKEMKILSGELLYDFPSNGSML